MQSAPWSFLNQTRHAFFLHVSNVSGIHRGVHMQSHTSYAKAWNSPFVLNKNFLVQTIIITFIYLLAIFIGPFHCSKFQKHSYSGSRVMKMHHFWVQNSPFVQMRIFSENLLMLYSFHSCLSTCQKSRSGINLLVKYWQLKNTEISLAESYFWQ